MTIHHDKLAYGKLASSQEDLSEQRLAEMLKKLNGTAPKPPKAEDEENPDGTEGEEGQDDTPKK